MLSRLSAWRPALRSFRVTASAAAPHRHVFSTTANGTGSRNRTAEGVPLGTAAVPTGTDLPGSDLEAETEQTIEQRELSENYQTYDKVPYHMRRPLRINEYGRAIMEEGLFNKGTSFGIGERDRLGLRGLIPSERLSMKQQLDRVRFQLDKEDTDIRKYQYLRDLQDRNETLFHRVLLDNIEELAPIVYTPTVGQACVEFGSSFRKPRGMFFSDYDRGDMASMMYNWPGRDVHVAVITDGGRVLGLGDLGANGMAITIGKLALYCSAGGIAPHRVLPIMFDAGTNNEALRDDPFYLGARAPRLEGDDYYTMLDELMFSLTTRFPNIFIQFEDFSSDRALDVLQRYRYQTLCFNDDIQGTGAVAVAGILSALEAQGKSADQLKEQRFVIAGSGSAGLGVVNALCESMVVQGLTLEEARSRFWVCDIDGVLGTHRTGTQGPPLTEDQLVFAKDDHTVGMNIEQVVSEVKPSVLIGLSTVSGLFNETIVTAMAAHNDRPIIFPLSNPTASAECTAENAYRWTNGRCIFGSGSPFDPVIHNGIVHTPSQVNNMFIFPGLGLGATLCGAKYISQGRNGVLFWGDGWFVVVVALADSFFSFFFGIVHFFLFHVCSDFGRHCVFHQCCIGDVFDDGRTRWWANLSFRASNS